MPVKPLRICNKAGCNTLSRGSYCEVHAVEVERKRQELLASRRGSAASRGYDYRWKKLRQHCSTLKPN